MTTITNGAWGVFECELCGHRVDKMYRRMDLKWICEDCIGETLRPTTFIEATITPRWMPVRPESGEGADDEG